MQDPPILLARKTPRDIRKKTPWCMKSIPPLTIKLLLSGFHVTRLSPFPACVTCLKPVSAASPTFLVQTLPQLCLFLLTKKIFNSHNRLPSTALYYKTCTVHIPVLLRTTRHAQCTSQYYFVVQDMHKVRPRTTSFHKACTEKVYAYAEKLLHAGSFCAQKLLHGDNLTQRNFHTENHLHTDAFTQKKIHTQKLLHGENFTHSKLSHAANFCTQRLFTHRNFYTQKTFIQKPLHRETSTHTQQTFYTEKFLHTANLLHRETLTQSKPSTQRNSCTQQTFYTEKLLHTANFTTHRNFYTGNSCTKRITYGKLRKKLPLQNRISAPKQKSEVFAVICRKS